MPDRPPHTFSKLAENLFGELRRVPSEDPARARKRPTRPLSELIEDVLQKNQIGRSTPEQTIREHWVEIVGPAAASYAHPARIERNMLVVLAGHAVVRNELFHHRAEIVARIRKLPGCSNVKALNLRAG
jgi:hypothetical protein